MPMLANSLTNLAAGLFIAAVLIAGLVLGRELLIPLALATVLAFVLSPIIVWLCARQLPRALSVTLVIMALVGLIGASSVAFSRQILAVTADLGTYRENILSKVRAVTGSGLTDGILSKAAKSITSIEQGVKQELGVEPAKTTPAGVNQPAPHVPPSDATALWQKAEPLASPLVQFGLTILLTLFLLLQSHDLRDRVVRLLGTDNISATTSALGTAGERLSKLFLTQTALNASFGIVVSLALWLIGIPNALLWGGVAFVMRFVPYIGSILATIPPLLLALAVDPGWGMAIATLAVFLIGEPLLGHVIEPLVLGKSAGLSPLAMVLSAGFWTVVWGPIGLILAAPITMTLVVLGHYVPRLEFLSVLLSDEPALAPEQELYHRLLAEDLVAGGEQIETALETSSVTEVADRIVMPALRLAARDRRLGRLDDERIAHLRQSMTDVEETLEANQAEKTGTANGEAAAKIDLPLALVIPARGSIDEIAASFAASVLKSTAEIRAIPIETSSGLMALSSARSSNAESMPDSLVIATVGGIEPRHLRYLALRAARDFPGVRILVCAWSDISAANFAVQGAQPDMIAIDSMANAKARLALRKSDDAAAKQERLEIEDDKAMMAAS